MADLSSKALQAINFSAGANWVKRHYAHGFMLFVLVSACVLQIIHADIVRNHLSNGERAIPGGYVSPILAFAAIFAAMAGSTLWISFQQSWVSWLYVASILAAFVASACVLGYQERAEHIFQKVVRNQDRTFAEAVDAKQSDIDDVLGSQRTAGYVAGSFAGIGALFVTVAWWFHAGDGFPRFTRA